MAGASARFLVLIICFVFYAGLDTASGACMVGTFGPNCALPCHCAGNTACDETTAFCPNGCFPGYTGPSCQAQNAAYQKGAYQLSGTGKVPQVFITDGHMGTCGNVIDHAEIDFGSQQTIGRIILRAIAPISPVSATVQVANESFVRNGQTACKASVPGTSVEYTCSANMARFVNVRGHFDLCELEVVPKPQQFFKPGRVLQVSATSQPRSIKVTWQQPAMPYRVIKSYGVHFLLLEVIGCETPENPTEQLREVTKTNTQTTNEETLLAGLYPNARYRISVTALTDYWEGGGESDRQTIIGLSGITAPTEAVSNLRLIPEKTSNTSLTWAWDPLSCEASGGGVTHYTVELVQSGLGTGFKDQTAGNDPTYTATNLTPYSQYTVTVTAANTQGIGRSVVAAGRTAEGMPGPVVLLSVHGQTADSLIVQWRAPQNPGGVVAKYKLIWQREGARDCDDNTSPPSEKVTVELGATNFYQIFSNQQSEVKMLPYHKYRVWIQARTATSDWGPEATAEGFTAANHPGPTNTIKQLQLTATTDTVFASWEPPACIDRVGPIQHYQYVLALVTNGQTIASSQTVSTNFMHSNLLKGVNYRVEVKYFTGTVFSTPVLGTVVTTNSVPPPPTTMKSSVETQNSFTLSWNFPEGIEITSIKVMCVSSANGVVLNIELTPMTKTYQVVGLSGADSVNCSVSATNTAGEGPAKTRVFFTAPDPPSAAPRPPRLVSGTNSTLLVYLYPPSYSGEAQFRHLVVVEKVSGMLSRRRKREVDTTRLYEYSYARSQALSYYVAAELEFASRTSANQQHPFKVGDSLMYNSYHNLPLQSGQTYRIGHIMYSEFHNKRAFSDIRLSESHVQGTKIKPEETDDDEEEKGGSDVNIPLIVGCVAGAVVLILIIVIIVIWNPRRGKCTGRQKAKELEDTVVLRNSSSGADGTFRNVGSSYTATNAVFQPDADVTTKPSRPNSNLTVPSLDIKDTSSRRNSFGDIHSSDPAAQKSAKLEHVYSNFVGPDPISLSELVAHVRKGRKDNRQLMKAEFDSIPMEMKLSSAEGRKPEHYTRNRFRNIYPYDQNRIVLGQMDETDTHYINASYLSGYKGKPKQYIAAQAPNNHTVGDFWRMLWQEKVHRIIMLSRLIEDSKIRCVKYWPDKEPETFGKFSVTLVRENTSSFFDTRVLSVMNQKTGENREVTQYHFTSWPDHGVPRSSRALIALIHEALAPGTPIPILVHCSAGVGRTGTLVALDLLLQAGEREKKVDIVGTVQHLRQQRMHSVQSIEQYCFIYDTLLEKLVSGDTYITADNFTDYWHKVKGRKGPKSLKAQFEVLDVLRPEVPVEALEHALTENNKSRNRSTRVLPPDICRPVLITDVPSSTDYINAVCVPVYGRKEPHIITQYPLPSTVGDFWRLVYDYSAGTVVMLTEDHSDKTMQPYWPERSGTQHLGSISVRHLASQPGDGVTWREFTVTNTSLKSNALTVRQFCLNMWPRGEATPSIPAVCELLDLITRWQQQSGDRPVIVHCTDGAERSGLLLALWSAMERLKIEQKVDVFRAARAVLFPRPQFLPTLEQYEFIHEVLVDYLDRFNMLYSNFN